jgi:hypothetical protein
MSSDQNTQPAVDDVADLAAHEADQIVGGMQDINIVKKTDKSSPSVSAPVTPAATGAPAGA